MSLKWGRLSLATRGFSLPQTFVIRSPCPCEQGLVGSQSPKPSWAEGLSEADSQGASLLRACPSWGPSPPAHSVGLGGRWGQPGSLQRAWRRGPGLRVSGSLGADSPGLDHRQQRPAGMQSRRRAWAYRSQGPPLPSSSARRTRSQAPRWASCQFGEGPSSPAELTAWGA